MIIPIRCFTCNKVLGDKWNPFIEAVESKKKKSKRNIDNIDIEYIDNSDTNIEKSIEGEVMDDMNIHRYCCRRIMIGNVHIISHI